MPLGPHSADRSTEAVVSREIWKCGEGLHGGPGEEPASFPVGGGGMQGSGPLIPSEPASALCGSRSLGFGGGTRVVATDSAPEAVVLWVLMAL